MLLILEIEYTSLCTEKIIKNGHEIVTLKKTEA